MVVVKSPKSNTNWMDVYWWWLWQQSDDKNFKNLHRDTNNKRQPPRRIKAQEATKKNNVHCQSSSTANNHDDDSDASNQGSNNVLLQDYNGLDFLRQSHWYPVQSSSTVAWLRRRKVKKDWLIDWLIADCGNKMWSFYTYNTSRDRECGTCHGEECELQYCIQSPVSTVRILMQCLTY